MPGQPGHAAAVQAEAGALAADAGAEPEWAGAVVAPGEAATAGR